MSIHPQEGVERASAIGPRILFAAGGTGGHIYPALAIADAIRQIAPRACIEFAGTQDRMEWEVVPKAGYAIHAIRAAGFDRARMMRNLRLPVRLTGGLVDSWRLISGFDPHVVVGTGGYVTGPVLWVAGLRKRPVVIQEQNAYAGVTNRLLARWASSIHVAFPEAEAFFPAHKVHRSGNPTRRMLLGVNRTDARAELGIPQAARVLFVFGGSLGSAAINAALEQIHARLLEDPTSVVLWQTGAGYFDRVRRVVHDHERLRVMRYVDRMDLLYAASDLVVSRAGAVTCSELLVTGTPAVLVPSPNVAEDHQTKNAQSMSDAGAAILLPEGEMDARLLDVISSLLRAPERLSAMTEAARRRARPDAAADIAKDVLSKASKALASTSIASPDA